MKIISYLLVALVCGTIGYMAGDAPNQSCFYLGEHKTACVDK